MTTSESRLKCKGESLTECVGLGLLGLLQRRVQEVSNLVTLGAAEQADLLRLLDEQQGDCERRLLEQQEANLAVQEKLCTDFAEERTRLQRALQSSQEEAARCHSRLSRAASQAEIHHLRNAELEGRLAQAQENCNHFRAVSARLEQRLAEAEAALLETRSSQSRQTQELEASTQRLRRVEAETKAQLERLQTRLAEKEEGISQLEKRLSEERLGFELRLTQLHKTHEAALEAEKDIQNRLTEKALAENAELRSQLQAELQRGDSLQRLTEKQKKEAASADERLRHFERTEEDAQSERRSLLERIQKLTAALDAESAKAAASAQREEVAASELAARLSSARELERQLKVAGEALAEAERRAACSDLTWRREVTELRKELSEKQERILLLEKKVHALGEHQRVIEGEISEALSLMPNADLAPEKQTGSEDSSRAECKLLPNGPPPNQQVPSSSLREAKACAQPEEEGRELKTNASPCEGAPDEEAPDSFVETQQAPPRLSLETQGLSERVRLLLSRLQTERQQARAEILEQRRKRQVGPRSQTTGVRCKPPLQQSHSFRPFFSANPNRKPSVCTKHLDAKSLDFAVASITKCVLRQNAAATWSQVLRKILLFHFHGIFRKNASCRRATKWLTSNVC